MRLENGLHADVYALEIIIPIVFRLNTYCTHVFRRWWKTEKYGRKL